MKLYKNSQFSKAHVIDSLKDEIIHHSKEYMSEMQYIKKKKDYLQQDSKQK